MRRKALKLSAMIFLGGALVAGCASDPQRSVVVTPQGEIVVPHRPPHNRQEFMGHPAIAGEVWMPGYWTYANAHWVWLPGHWQQPPSPKLVWRPGQWHSDPRGWVWSPGHWE